MTLILKHTNTGMLWLQGEEVSPAWSMPERYGKLAQEIEEWYRTKPIYRELMPAFDAMGAELAVKIRSAVGCEVIYEPAAF